MGQSVLGAGISVLLVHKEELFKAGNFMQVQGSQFKQATGDISGCGEVDRRL